MRHGRSRYRAGLCLESSSDFPFSQGVIRVVPRSYFVPEAAQAASGIFYLKKEYGNYETD